MVPPVGKAQTPTGIPLRVDDATLRAWLADDLGSPPRDATSDPLFGRAEPRGRAIIVSREALTVSGMEEALRVFGLAGALAVARSEDGQDVAAGAPIAEIEGPARSILRAERTALNILGRMSGIASETRRIQGIVSRINPQCRVAATRKTTPGFRALEKKAVWHGGGDPHRYGLFDQVLVKDNHRAAASDLRGLIARLRAHDARITLEVEVENEADAVSAAESGAHILLLDNMSPPAAARAAQRARETAPHIQIECSGGITADNVADYAPFCDRVSLGALTQSARARDVALDWLGS